MLDEEMKEVLRRNICYFATSTKDGKPNVIPVGLVEPIDNSRILLVDVKMNKTRKILNFQNVKGKAKPYQVKQLISTCKFLSV